MPTKSSTASKKPLRAIVKIGAKQYLVAPNQELTVEKIPQKPKSKIVFKEVLAVVKGEEQLKDLGKPFCDSTVEAEVIEEIKAKKIYVQKYKSKTRYRKKIGHRQILTRIKIIDIK